MVKVNVLGLDYVKQFNTLSFLCFPASAGNKDGKRYQK